MKQDSNEKFTASLLFFFASVLTGLVSIAAFCFVWAKQKAEKRSSIRNVEGYLADEQRALNFYKIFSVAYDTLNPYLYTVKMRKEILGQVRKGVNLRLLDVGCGTGYTTAGILNRDDVCEAVGVDMNPVQIKRAEKNLLLEKERLSISRCDADNLPFLDETFDAVISVGAIEYFPDPQRVLKEFARVTRPAGTVVVCGPEAEWFSKFAINKIFYTPSINEMQTLFLTAGLLKVKAALTGVDTIFGTEKYVVFAVGTKPRTKSVLNDLDTQ